MERSVCACHHSSSVTADQTSPALPQCPTIRFSQPHLSRQIPSPSDKKPSFSDGQHSGLADLVAAVRVERPKYTQVAGLDLFRCGGRSKVSWARLDMKATVSETRRDVLVEIFSLQVLSYSAKLIFVTEKMSWVVAHSLSLS